MTKMTVFYHEFWININVLCCRNPDYNPLKRPFEDSEDRSFHKIWKKSRHMKPEQVPPIQITWKFTSITHASFKKHTAGTTPTIVTTLQWAEIPPCIHTREHPRPPRWGNILKPVTHTKTQIKHLVAIRNDNCILFVICSAITVLFRSQYFILH